jgi:lipopolysaccharide export LptBFGC system permease protein LptF
MILQRYILRELLLSFMFTFAALMAVFLVGTLFQLFRTFEGLGLLLLFKALPLAMGYMAMWALTVASCMAATLVYGRLAAENEIHAMQVNGIHANRIMAPALLFGLGLAIVGYGINEKLLPYVRHNRRLSFREATLQALQLPPPGKQEFTLGQYKLSYTDYVKGRMERPTLMRFDRGRLVFEYFAASGSILAGEHPPKLVLSRPRCREIDEKGNEHSFSAESDVTIPLEIEEVRQAERRQEDLPAEELWRLSARTEEPEKRARILLILHTRYGSALAPLLLALVASPIGIFVKRGSRLAGLGTAIPPLLLYFVTYFIFQGLGDKGHVPHLVAAYAPDGLLLVLALALLGRIYRK